MRHIDNRHQVRGEWSRCARSASASAASVATASAVLAVCAVGFIGQKTAAAGPPQYVVTMLSPDADYGVAWAIDDDANIAGEGTLGCAALWKKSGIEWIFSTAAPDCGVSGFVVPTAINGGVIVGWASNGAFGSHAIAIHDSAFAFLPAGSQAWASDVNAAGQIVGTMAPQTGFLFENEELSVLPVGSTAEAITPDGVVLGSADGHAAFWHRIDNVWTATPLGVKAHASVARAINANGQVVGEFQAVQGGAFRPFLWHDGDVIEFATLGGDNAVAVGVTAAGEVVGWSDVPGEVARPFIWRDGDMHDLNDLVAPSSVELVYAFACNAQGQIVGWAKVEGSASLPFVATPIVEGDLNLDARVNGADLAVLLGTWGSCAGCSADINNDGVIDGADLAIVLASWTD